MHTNRKTYQGIGGDCIMEQWYIIINIFDKIMKIQQQGSPGNYVVFDCLVGDAICMNTNYQGRGIDEYACGVRLQYGCPK